MEVSDIEITPHHHEVDEMIIPVLSRWHSGGLESFGTLLKVIQLVWWG